MSSLSTDYWAPRQILDYGLVPISPLTDAGIEGITDEGTYSSKLFFRVAGAPPGDTPSSPVWDAGTPGWLNTSSASTPVTFVGRSVDGAGSNSSNLTCEISGNSVQVISLTELESPTGGAYTMPAGDWKVRFMYRGATARGAGLYGAKIVLVDRFTSGSTTYYGTNGASSSVHYSYTTSPQTVLGSIGTYTMSFTTSSSVAVSATQKLVVMTLVEQTSGSTNTITYRHNLNLLTPWASRVFSMDPVAVALSPVAATGVVVSTPTNISQSPVTVALSAVPATSVSVPTQTTISQGPAAIALAAVPATAVDVPLPVNISQGPAAVALSALGASSIARTMVVAAPATVALAPQAPTVSLVLSVSAQAAAIAVAGVAPTRIDREVRSSPAAVALAAVPATSVIVPAATNISQGPAAVALAAVSATAVDVPAATSISQGPAAVALAAVSATSVDVPNAINISSSPVAVAFQVQGGAVAADRTVVIAAPATVALAALAISELIAPLPSERAAVRVVSSTVRKYLTATAHTAAKRSQCASIGGAIVRSPSVKPTPPRSPRSRGRTIASVTERSEVARSRTVPIPARTATSRFFVAASGEARQRLAGGEAMAAISNRDGPSLTNSSGVL